MVVIGSMKHLKVEVRAFYSAKSEGESVFVVGKGYSGRFTGHDNDYSYLFARIKG